MAELNHTAFKLSCTWVVVGQIPKKVLAAYEQITSKFELFVAEIEQISNLNYQRVNRG